MLTRATMRLPAHTKCSQIDQNEGSFQSPTPQTAISHMNGSRTLVNEIDTSVAMFDYSRLGLLGS